MFCNPNVLSSTEEQSPVGRPARVVADQISDSSRGARQYRESTNLFLNIVDAEGTEKFRRGYRFIGSVTPLKSTKSDPRIVGVSAEEESRTRSGSTKQLAADLRILNGETDTAETPTLQANSGVARPRTFAPAWWMWATILVIAVALLLGIFWWHRPLPQPRIVATRQLTHDSALKQALVTDGNRIYFVEKFWQTARLAQVSVSGGEVSFINSGTSLPDLGDISPDGFARQRLNVSRIVRVIPSTCRSLFTAAFSPCSKSTKVSEGHSSRRSSSRVTNSPGRVRSILRI